MIRNYKRFVSKEARIKFQAKLFDTIHYCAFNCKDAYYVDALCAIRDAYNASLREEVELQTVISHGAFLVVRNAFATLSNEALGEDEDFIAEQIGDLIDLLGKAVGDDD